MDEAWPDRHPSRSIFGPFSHCAHPTRTFFDLPVEIRNIIYYEVLDKPSRISCRPIGDGPWSLNTVVEGADDDDSVGTPGLESVSHQIRSEVLPILRGQVTVHLRKSAKRTFAGWLQAAGEEARQLRQVTLCFTVDTYRVWDETAPSYKWNRPAPLRSGTTFAVPQAYQAEMVVRQMDDGSFDIKHLEASGWNHAQGRCFCYRDLKAAALEAVSTKTDSLDASIPHQRPLVDFVLRFQELCFQGHEYDGRVRAKIIQGREYGHDVKCATCGKGRYLFCGEKPIS